MKKVMLLIMSVLLIFPMLGMANNNSHTTSINQLMLAQQPSVEAYEMRCETFDVNENGGYIYPDYY